jgi:hypothetical protein
MSFAVLVVLLLFNSFGLSWDEACMGQCGHCSVLFPRDRSWFVQYPTLLIEWLFHLCLRFYIMLSSNLNLGRLQRHYHMDACVWPHFCIALQLVFFSFFLLEISRSRCVTCVWMHIFDVKVTLFYKVIRLKFRWSTVAHDAEERTPTQNVSHEGICMRVLGSARCLGVPTHTTGYVNLPWHV